MRARAEDELLALVAPVRRYGQLVTDLRRVDWVTPATMVAVAAQAHRARAAGEPFVVRAPSNAEPARYAGRMRLGLLLDDLGAHHDFPTVPERDQSANLVELARIRTGVDAARLAGLVYAKLDPFDRTLASALHRSIGEVGENVPDHAGSIGFMAAQTMPRRRMLLLAVADAGRGLLTTLAARGARDHENAIELATTPRVSRLDDPTRGGGLPDTLRLVRGVGGTLYIASGTAAISHLAQRRRFLRGEHAYHGTIVEARIPLRATLDGRTEGAGHDGDADTPLSGGGPRAGPSGGAPAREHQRGGRHG